jgi:cysteinyl-tRNA synthetase
MADLRWQLVDSAKSRNVIDFKSLSSTINEALTNDLNTPQVLADLSAISRLLVTHPVTQGQKSEFQEFLEHIDKSLGLKLLDSRDMSQEQKQLVKDRENARANNDWGKSDELRDKLKSQGIEIRDTDYGPVWNRV